MAADLTGLTPGGTDATYQWLAHFGEEGALPADGETPIILYKGDGTPTPISLTATKLFLNGEEVLALSPTSDGLTNPGLVLKTDEDGNLRLGYLAADGVTDAAGTGAVLLPYGFASDSSGPWVPPASGSGTLESQVGAQTKADDAQAAAEAYADSLVIGLVDDRGSFDASINTFPTTGGSGTAGAIEKGDLWTISVIASSGSLLGYPVGTLIRALVDAPGQTVGNWAITVAGFGYTAENAANKSTSVPTDLASNTKYPSVKAVYDWAMAAFATAAQGTDSREWSADTVSQAEAEAGAATTRRAWTAERVFQAIAAQIATHSAATDPHGDRAFATSAISTHSAATDPHGDRAYADSLVVGLVDDRGNFDASVNAFPTTGGSGTAGAILKGDLWTISVVASSGVLNGYAVGTLIRALVDAPGQTAGNWAITAVGFGYSPENSANKSTSVVTDQASNTKYPSVKAVYDWAVGLFATITGAQTITNKRNQPRTTSSTTASTLTPDLSVANIFFRTTQTGSLTINAPTGTPVSGEPLVIYVDSAGAQTLTMDATYKAFGTAFPATTTAGKTLMITAQYDPNALNWKTLWITQV